MEFSPHHCRWGGKPLIKEGKEKRNQHRLGPGKNTSRNEFQESNEWGLLREYELSLRCSVTLRGSPSKTEGALGERSSSISIWKKAEQGRSLSQKKTLLSRGADSNDT